MSSKDKKLVQERVKIPAYGDEKIDEAKGKWFLWAIFWVGFVAVSHDYQSINNKDCIFLIRSIGAGA